MSKHLWLRMKKILLPAGLALALTGAGCAAPETVDPRIGLIGAAAPLQRVDEALTRMGERFELIEEVNPPALAGYELIILNRGAHALNDAGLADNFSALLDWVREGGALLVFEIDAAGYRSEFLPYEIVFSDKAAAGKEDWDFVEQVEAPEHPVFNRPHRIDYLRGLEESWRIVRTGPQWRILASKDPRPPSLDPRIEKLDNSAGSIFEAGYGRGAVLVCQPMVARYHAGCVSNEPHYLEAGVLLFENIVEYMKAAAAGTSLPVVSARAVPTTGDAGQSVHLRALPGGDTAEPCTYAWDFGDGAASEEPDPVHVYGKEGVFRPAVRVTDARGRVDRDACRVELGPARPMRWADQLVKAQIHRHYPDPTRRQRDYPTALVLQGMLDVYGRTRNDEILEYVKGFFEPLVRRREHDPESSTFNYGSLMVPAYGLYRITGERVYLEMAMKYWKSSIAEIDSQLGPGMFWGLGGRRTIVDLLYFFCNERALYYEVTGEVSALDMAADQLALFTGYLLDPADSLYFQAIDLDRSSYWCSPERPTGLNDSKWGRGNGWVAMAFTELLLHLPPGHPRREMLRGTVLGFFSGLLRAQDPETGLWAQVTDKRDYPGMWLETTSTSMFVYSTLRLVEAGLLPAEPFLAMARRGYNGLQQRLKMGAFSYPYLSDACMGTGPMFSLERWLQAQRRSNDRHVVGPFLMAEEALWRAAPPAVAVIGDLSAPESRLGPALNCNGLYFYQVPDLYTTADLDSFSAVIVDRFALDRNAANLEAYFGRLLDYAERGGRVLFFPQQDTGLLAGFFPGAAAPVTSKTAGPPVVVRHGRGELYYCRDYPEAGGNLPAADRLRNLAGFAFLRRLAR